MSVMRRGVAVYWVFVLLLSALCGCTAVVPEHFSGYNVKELNNWSFQYNPGSNDYSLFFGLLDGKQKAVSAIVNVDVRIVNEVGDEVYQGAHQVADSDFRYYTSEARGEQYLANVRIPAGDITPGRSNNGEVMFTVYNDLVAFEEVSCKAFFCLPVADVELSIGTLPVELKTKNYGGEVDSILRIDDVSYVFEKDFSFKLDLVFSGEKTYESKDGYGLDKFAYKLYDADGYVVETGNVFVSDIDVGDKFREEATIYGIAPGETYALELLEYD